MRKENNKLGRLALISAGVLALLGFFGWFLWGGHQPPLPDKPELPAAPTPTIQQPVARSSLPRMAPLPTEETRATTAPPAATETNAADFYRRAFALYDALSVEEKKACEDWKAEIDADAAARLCEKVGPILDQMHQATAVTNCDWGTGPYTPDTVQTVFPYLAHARALARTAAWSAAHCRRNDSTGATDDLLANLQLGHNMPQSALVGFLVETVIQMLTADFVTQNASRFDEADEARLIQAFSDPSYEESLYRAIEQEADFVRLYEVKPGSPLPAEVRQFFGGTNGGSLSFDPSLWNEWIRHAAELEREYATVLAQPEAQYQAWLGRVQAAQESNPFMRMVWPAMDKVVDNARAVVVQRTMVSAGLAVLQAGPDALATYPDPATGQPFQYQETADGFQLQSVYQRRGQPVTMVFRRQNKSGW